MARTAPGSFGKDDIVVDIDATFGKALELADVPTVRVAWDNVLKARTDTVEGFEFHVVCKLAGYKHINVLVKDLNIKPEAYHVGEPIAFEGLKASVGGGYGDKPVALFVEATRAGQKPAA